MNNLKAYLLLLSIGVLALSGMAHASKLYEIGHTPTSPGGPATDHFYLLGSNVLVSTTAIGGSGNYLYSWSVWSGFCSNNSTLVTNAFSTSTYYSFNYTPTAFTSNCILKAAITDALNSSDLTYEPTGIIRVVPNLNATITPSSKITINIMSSTLVGISATGETGNYTYAWSVNPADSCPGEPSGVFTSNEFFTYKPTSPTSNCVFDVVVNSVFVGNTMFSSTFKTNVITVTNAQTTSTTTSISTTTTSIGTTIPCTTTTIPYIILPESVKPSNSSGNVKVQVSGFGFTPNVHLQFGYYPIPPYTDVLIDTNTGINGNWSASFPAPWGTRNYTMFAIDANGVNARANLVVSQSTTSTTETTTSIGTTIPCTTTIPYIILPTSVKPSNSSGNVKVQVSGVGFAPNVHLQFGYYPIPPFTNVLIDTNTSTNGNWSASFPAPWGTGDYTMFAVDAKGTNARANLVVTESTTSTTTTSIGTTIPCTTTIPYIILPTSAKPSNSSGNVRVQVSGVGFTPNAHLQFGYYPIPPYTDILIDTNTSTSGNWLASFPAPWIAGNYTMFAVDAKGASARANLMVT